MSSSNVSREFNQLILEAIDDALSVLGDEPVKSSFYYHLEKRANIEHHEIPNKLEDFHEALTGLFYDGAVILERRICRSLYAKLHFELPRDNGCTLKECVREALERYESL
jgi:hypothetical protein